MLSEFASIVEEIVRGAEELQKALVRARTELAATATALKASSVAPVQAGSVLNLDQFREANAKAISQALREASGPRTGGEPIGKQEAVSPAGSVLNLDQFREANAKAISQALREAMAETLGPATAATAVGMQGSLVPAVGGAVLNLDRFQEVNARALSQAWREAMAETLGPATAATAAGMEEQARTAEQLADQLRKLQPDIERISRKLQEHRTKPAASARETARSLAERPLRGGERRYRPLRERPMSWGQRLLQSRRGRVFRWRLERSRSPLRRYVGQALSRYAERGNARRLFLELSRAPAAMRSPQAVQQAARAGMTAQQLARGAQVVGMAGRVGGMAATAAGLASNPIGWAILFIAAAVQAARVLHRFARAQEEAVFQVQEMAQRFARIHAGFAAIEARQVAARLQEERRLATRTLGTSELYARMAERYRRDTEEWRVFEQHLRNLVGYAKIIAAYAAKSVTGGLVLEMAIKRLNELMEKLSTQERTPPTTWQRWLTPYREANVALPRRQAPAAPFNRGPKKK